MAKHKVEIGSISPGNRFYFPNDPNKIVWRVLDSDRTASTNISQRFIYCEDAEGNIQDWNSNRDVFPLGEFEMPPADDMKEEKVAEPVVMIHKRIQQPTPVKKINFDNFLNNLKTPDDMQHKESSIKVYATSNYSVFRMVSGNRNIKEKKVKKIIAEIDAGNDMLAYYPIQVREAANDRLNILDGQHRFYISKKLKRPVYYILVAEEKSMVEIAKINSNVDKWKNIDFINCYVEHGDQNYIQLQTFLNTYKFSLSITLLLLSTGTPGTEGSPHPEIGDEFQNGTFKVKCLAEAESLAKDVYRFEDFANCRSRPFVIAIYRIRKAGLITIDELYQAYKRRPEMLTQQANFKAYINTLEQIVNVGKQKRIVITN